MDGLAIAGVCLAFIAIIGGNFLEGGQLSALLNTPAVIIVFGGTLGAVVLQTPRSRLIDAARMLRWVLLPPVLGDERRHQENVVRGAPPRGARVCSASKTPPNAKRIRLRAKASNC